MAVVVQNLQHLDMSKQLLMQPFQLNEFYFNTCIVEKLFYAYFIVADIFRAAYYQNRNLCMHIIIILAYNNY